MRASSKTLLFALAMAGCSIYDETLGDVAGATSGRAGTGGTSDSGASTGGFSGTGGSTSKGGSSGAAGDADVRGTGGGGGTAGTAGTSMTDSAAGRGGVSGAAGTSGVDAAGGSGTAGAGGAAGGSGTAGTGGSTGVDGSSGADRSSGLDGADAAQPCVTGPGPANLPFAVDQYFVASGWMQAALIRQEASCVYPPAADAGATVDGGGDASVGTDSATIPDAANDRNGTGDGGTRPPLPGSRCWTITYAPVAASDWAGVDWQYPIDNWGPSPGLVIPPGATRVSLVAWGALGSEKVSFQVGYGPASPDGFGVSLTDQVLTPSPTRYAVELSGIAYTCNSVRMGFGWVAAGGTSMTFHIADVRWE